MDRMILRHMLNSVYGTSNFNGILASEFDGDLINIYVCDAHKNIFDRGTRIKINPHDCALDAFRYAYGKYEIKKVIFNDPATIVLWRDGTKTVVKCQDGEIFDKEKGLSMAIAKKALGNKGNYYDVFKKWLPEEKKEEV